MRHRNKIAKLNMPAARRKSVLRNLATSIILYEKVQTTEAKAKAVVPVVEDLITKSKQEDQVKAIREINMVVFDKNASRKLMQDLRKRYADRQSGYTRTTNMGYRMGDAAKMIQIELI